MAVGEENPNPKPYPTSIDDTSALLSSYLGISFAVFLGFIPRSSLSHIASLQYRNRILSLKLFHAEEQLHQMVSRRKEDSKANARVVEIFASHRNAWQEDEKRFLNRIEAAADEIATLRSRISEMERTEAELRCSIERLRGEVAERDEILDLMSKKESAAGVDGEAKEVWKNEVQEVLDVEEEEEGDYCCDYERMGTVRVAKGMKLVPESCSVEESGDPDDIAMMYCRENRFRPAFLPNAEWQDIKFDSPESTYYGKHNVARREYPWKVNSDAAGVSSKLNLLEQELGELEKVEKVELTKVSLFLRKLWKRYQSLAGKIDDLCSRMQLSDAYEPTLSPEFRTQQQTVYLVEASALQLRAKEMRQKLNTLQAETATVHIGDELAASAKLSMRRSMDSMRNGFKEMQRNLEIWLARIMGDLEGVLAREGKSRVRDYYLSQYPFI
ncbi:uncharacterized protein LOC110020138 [Phalaenopsis equestris]|uniref:uncharacterized protein LOC110020138 n=1 Tax=Phalaenopsis equestris TaxID=78828 RepID=UPI0009E30F96|nr:uncharacterized protein LOC110020138 [Phalaenopsis equestris]